jgi:hypothetical protein
MTMDWTASISWLLTPMSLATPKYSFIQG